MKHAAQCGHCGPLLKNASETIADEATLSEQALLASLRSAQPEWGKNMAARLRDSVRDRQRKDSRWRAFFAWPTPAYAFAGVALVALVSWIGMRTLHPPSAEQLLAQAYTEHRTLEVRIPGAKYAPMQAERGHVGSDFDKSPSLLKAEVLIGESLTKDPNDSDWLQAQARADLLAGNYESAIKSLNRALDIKPDTPSLLTDMGSAYFLRAESADRPIDYGNAIESLGKALAKAPDDPISLFNRALVCERMFLYAQAVEDWEHYLRVDSQGEWSDDARRRLSALKDKLRQHDKSQNDPLLSPDEMVKAGTQDVVVTEKISGQIEQYMDEAIQNWLPIAFSTNDVDASPALRNLNYSALTLLAHVLATRHQDMWLMDLLQTKPSADFSLGLQSLARAAKANAAGDPDLAFAEAQHAKESFRKAVSGSGNIRADFEEIYALHRQYRLQSCLARIAEIEPALRKARYPWISAQISLERYACASTDLDSTSYTLAIARKSALQAGYGTLYLRALGFCASNETGSGATDRAWVWDRAGLEKFWSGQYPPARAQHFYDDLSISAEDSAKWFLAVVLEREAVSAIAASPNRTSEGIERIELARSASKAHLWHEAGDQYSKALAAFSALRQDSSIRALLASAEIGLGEVALNQGHIRDAEPHIRYARENLPPDFDENQTWAALYTEVAELRRLTDDPDGFRRACQAAVLVAEADLKGIHSELERLRWKERNAACYRALVQLELSNNDETSALELWEWYRSAGARVPGSHLPRGVNFANLDQSPALPAMHEVTSLLPSLERETVVVYAELGDWVDVWVYDNRGIFWYRVESTPSSLDRAGAAFAYQCSSHGSDLKLLRASGRRLYDLLVGPIASYLDPNRTLVVEADDGLAAIPFAALVDPTGAYLVDNFRLAYLPSIGYRPVLRSGSRISRRDAALIVSSPALSVKDQAHYPVLPSAQAEAENVASHFDRPTLLTGKEATGLALSQALPSAAVFHFAGHARLEPGHSGLLLAPESGGPDAASFLLTADHIAEQPLSHLRLAVLSACSTALNASEDFGGAGSLARAFLRSGVPDVIASRWSVDSAATEQLMHVFYQHAMEADAPGALQSSMRQVRSLPGRAHPYYWAAFDVFGGVGSLRSQ